MKGELREVHTWNGTHLDVPYEIKHWDWDAPKDLLPSHMVAGVWNYYVLFNELQTDEFEQAWLPPSKEWLRSNGTVTPTYDYYNSVLNDGEFHGGITFYEKQDRVDVSLRRVKVGCDYAHYWDEASSYNENILKMDAINTINKLDRIFRFKRRCRWNGTWLPADQMKEINGVLYSPEGFKAHKEAWPEKAAAERESDGQD
jgi:hypothetical protein